MNCPDPPWPAPLSKALNKDTDGRPKKVTGELMYTKHEVLDALTVLLWSYNNLADCLEGLTSLSRYHRWTGVENFLEWRRWQRFVESEKTRLAE